MECLNCKLPFESRNRNHIQKKFCSDRCRTQYNSRQYCRAGKKKLYIQKNKKKIAEYQLEYYYRNKQRAMSRMLTYQIFSSENKICKLCGSTNNLEVHHEKYPTTVAEIKREIENGTIYFLCKKCHTAETNKHKTWFKNF